MPTHTQSERIILTTRRISTIQPKPLQWLWHSRIPKGKLTLLAADPGTGKTTLALTLAAHLSRGEPLPHNTSPLSTKDSAPSTPAATLLLSPEDNAADTLRPKLEALHANLDLIHHFEDFHSLIPLETQNMKLETPPTPLECLESVIESLPNLALVIIDPITYYLGLTDKTLHTSNPTQIRSTLHALANLAEKYNLAILLTTRLTKSPQTLKTQDSRLTAPLHHTLGSLAFASAARSVLLLTPLPTTHLTPGESPGAHCAPPPTNTSPYLPISPTTVPIPSSLETRNPKLETPPAHSPMNNDKSSMNNPPPTHLLLSIKSNLSAPPPPLALSITHTLTFLPSENLPSLPPTTSPTPRDVITQSAADWLLIALNQGPVSAYAVTQAAKDNAIPTATLNRAKQLLGIQSVRQDWSKKWFWQLPHETRPLPENSIERTLAEIFEVDNLAEKTPFFKPKPDNLARNIRLLQKEVDNLSRKNPKSSPKNHATPNPQMNNDKCKMKNPPPLPPRDKLPSPEIPLTTRKDPLMGYESEISHGNIAAKLNAINQSHLLKFWPELTPDQQNAFASQLAALDWDLIAKLIDTMIKHPHKFELTGDVQPAPYYEHAPTDPAQKQKLHDAFQHGEQLLRDGKVAAFVVAGGQGTRLGWDGPKGTYPATPVKHKTLFQCFADFLLATNKRYKTNVPFYIMTSPANDQPTRDFWQKHNHFGMNPSDVMFFPQDELPAISPDGKILLQSKDSLALSPNGHGGSLLALYKSGAITDMKNRGITQISYFQVDNPIVRCVDPTFLGLHDFDHAQMSSKMLPKTGPKEKLGNLCLIDNKMSVIEYSDLPENLAEARNENGELKFRAGSIALHAIRVDFVEELNREGFALPFHRADKKVPCIDLNTGEPITPTKPNAVKLETFVFDALPLTDKSIIYETDRQDEFAPIKNAEGVDSAQSSIQITTARNTAWLQTAGLPVPPGTLLEIAPSFALYPTDIPPKKSQVPPLAPGAKIYLE